jgi:hypothetical protein
MNLQTWKRPAQEIEELGFFMQMPRIETIYLIYNNQEFKDWLIKQYPDIQFLSDLPDSLEYILKPYTPPAFKVGYIAEPGEHKFIFEALGPSVEFELHLNKIRKNLEQAQPAATESNAEQPPNFDLDWIDQEILRIKKKTPKIKDWEIGQQLGGIDRVTVNRHKKVLERLGLITTVVTSVATKKRG